jgi:hypothetical protein
MTRPLSIDLAFQVECASFKSDISGHDEENKGDPEKEGVDCQKRTVVHEDTGPTYESCENAYGSSQRRYDQLRAITNPNNIGMGPNVEPGQETEYKCDERIDGQLKKKPTNKNNV